MVQKPTSDKCECWLVDRLFAAMYDSLMAGNRMEIRGVGMLEVKPLQPKPAARNLVQTTHPTLPK